MECQEGVEALEDLKEMERFPIWWNRLSLEVEEEDEEEEEEEEEGGGEGGGGGGGGIQSKIQTRDNYVEIMATISANDDVKMTRDGAINPNSSCEHVHSAVVVIAVGSVLGLALRSLEKENAINSQRIN
ncbi:hypothetical protein ANN_19682 [Periplaneta americana]|uniref:Uncharacterized protein n=1 Tax=Periplaneta americana TaxID=6978 RepID=A0ABQ8SAV9_PERAM|nr:hypothetical protein ANN_19682 [Periplaneta americana]